MLSTTFDVSTRVAIGLIVLLALVTLFSLCGSDFTKWDDEPFIAKNPRIVDANLKHFIYYWTHPYHTIYIPLTCSFWIVLSAIGRSDVPDPNGILLNPYLFHTFNLVVHIAAGCAAFWVLRLLFKRNWPALTGALVFVLHPVQVESVGWVSGSKDLLGGGLSLVAIGAYLAAASQPVDVKPIRRRWYVASLVFFTLAMLAKPSAMTTAALVVAIDGLALRRDWKVIARWSIPFFVLAAMCAGVARWAQPVSNQITPPPASVRPLIAAHAVAFYLGKVAWPARLTVDYGLRPSVVIASGAHYFAWIVPVLVSVGAAVLYRRWRWLAVGLAVFILAPFHVLGWVPFDFQAFSTTADHYLYVSMLGIAIVVAAAVNALPSNWGVPMVATLCLAMGVRSHVQTAAWKDADSLIERGLKANPNSSVLRTSLAAILVDRQDYHGAVREAERAIRDQPEFVLSYSVQGLAKAHLGDMPGAIVAFRTAVASKPDFSEFRTNLGSALAQQGDLVEAEHQLREAIRYDTYNAAAHANLGALLSQKGHLPAAEASLRQAVSLAPADVQTRYNLGLVLLGLHRRAEAAEQLKEAYRLNPNFPGVSQTLAEYGIPLTGTP